MPETPPLRFGLLNEHGVGIILKELVRRAIVVIRNERLAFEVQTKASYGPLKEDVVTSADRKAQEVYIRSLRECFPGFGIIAEEENLALPPRRGRGYLTVDPLDGTKAFIRRQSHGIGTMIALVWRNQVQAAYVGDINTREIYGYRPGANVVHRISEFEAAEPLRHHKRALRNQFLLLRDPVSSLSPPAQRLAEYFREQETNRGSIGIWFARLWKREVGAALLGPGTETPWDSAPVLGISGQLGYRFFRPHGEGWQAYTPPLSTQTYTRDHDLLVLHEDDVPQLEKLLTTP